MPATRSRSLGGEVLASDHTTATHEGYALQQGAGVRECEALLKAPAGIYGSQHLAIYRSVSQQLVPTRFLGTFVP